MPRTTGGRARRNTVALSLVARWAADNASRSTHRREGHFAAVDCRWRGARGKEWAGCFLHLEGAGHGYRHSRSQLLLTWRSRARG